MPQPLFTYEYHEDFLNAASEFVHEFCSIDVIVTLTAGAMPCHVIEEEFYESGFDSLFISEMETNEKRVEVLKKLLDILPVDKKEMIQTIMRHLKR